jgi:hypothetical protein
MTTDKALQDIVTIAHVGAANPQCTFPSDWLGGQGGVSEVGFMCSGVAKSVPLVVTVKPGLVGLSAKPVAAGATLEHKFTIEKLPVIENAGCYLFRPPLP